MEDIKNLEILISQEIRKQLKNPPAMTLDMAKDIMEEVEREAVRRGMRVVTGVVNAQGNPVAVHVMDDSLLVSFDLALKKAYTAVAVKMSTQELLELAQPGGELYGIEKTAGGRIVIVTGGVLLKAGACIVGGLGVSGGTARQDYELACYGAEIFSRMVL